MIPNTDFGILQTVMLMYYMNMMIIIVILQW